MSILDEVQKYGQIGINVLGQVTGGGTSSSNVGVSGLSVNVTTPDVKQASSDITSSLKSVNKTIWVAGGLLAAFLLFRRG
jgi:hypothetical protein